MSVLAIVGIVLVGLLVFVASGLLGWVIQGIGEVFGFLMEGCGTTVGCLFWVVVGSGIAAFVVAYFKYHAG
jgi:hypothetical protein